jgi:uncharacterized protein (DUF1330 family)
MARLPVILPGDRGRTSHFVPGRVRPGARGRTLGGKVMRKLTTAAIGAACFVVGAGGATLYTHAATGPAFYAVYEANVTDEDAYKKALPEAQKIIKEAGGVYIAGGFNKAKVDHGKPEAGNRVVIIRYENEAAYDKFYNGGGKAWIDKHAPDARELKVEGVEQK